ncbi:hypothetical protein FY557_04045 [Chryseobacterium sp. SN22]|uniref:hypothetical protein n=1 Tax=Chryseobacterium sp. SN22 TaxID=2606431 RepID=UPI0011ED3B93|nr:hypothetical protein [Chryseobacterium sp. SN22]KAA0129887.1 hypothetical protein FY557_04045 [Chryseobacterium sp. SN22]
MLKLITKLHVLVFLFLGILGFSQEKKQFSSVPGLLQRIVPNIKTDSWVLIHKSYGRDEVVKKVGAVKDYTSPSSGFNIGIAEEDEFYYIVYSTGGKTGYVTDLEGLKKFVGKADDVQEAAILAAADGYIIDEEFKDMAGNYYEDSSNYYLDLGKLTSTECPYQKKHYTLTVNKSSETVTSVKDNGAYIELYNKKCTNNPRLLKIEKKEEPQDEPKKKSSRPAKRR